MVSFVYSCSHFDLTEFSVRFRILTEILSIFWLCFYLVCQLIGQSKSWQPISVQSQNQNKFHFTEKIEVWEKISWNWKCEKNVRYRSQNASETRIQSQRIRKVHRGKWFRSGRAHNVHGFTFHRFSFNRIFSTLLAAKKPFQILTHHFPKFTQSFVTAKK